MGNSNGKPYQINKSAIVTIDPKRKRKDMNKTNKILHNLMCTKAKRSDKDKPDLQKSLPCVNDKDDYDENINRYSVGNFDRFIESCDDVKYANDTPQKKNAIISEILPMNTAQDDKNNNTKDVQDIIGCSQKDLRDKQINEGQSPKMFRAYGRLSETSLNSDDLMLSTDVNLDQADDDVSKDYNASEKDDPFLSALSQENPKCDGDDTYQICAEDSEKNDIVYFDSSRESSVSLQRKVGYRGYTRRPHSFSTPLRSDSLSKVKRSSNLSTVDSIDLAWTWMSASESANLAQEISNLKLLLLKTKRLLLDDYNNDQFSTLNEDDTSVFSEPNTPIYCNDQQRMASLESECPSFSDWYNMDKETLIQELQDVYKQNASLQCQLHDKNRVIELLQDGRRRFHRPHARTEPFVSRIGRSSTFDSSAMLNPLSPTIECSSVPITFSNTGKINNSESRNIDSGLYQSSSSTDSCVYQN